MLVWADRVMETTTTTGTGTLTLAGAVTGYKAVNSISSGNSGYFSIWGVDGNGVPTGEYEVTGPETLTLGSLLSRTGTVYSSSNSNSRVNFSAGTKRVALVFPAHAIGLSNYVSMHNANDIVIQPNTATYITYDTADEDTDAFHTFNTTHSGTVTGATNANPIVITTSAPHGLSTGQGVQITGVLGNLAANTVSGVTVLSATTFSIIPAPTGAGAYTSGGTWKQVVSDLTVPTGLGGIYLIIVQLRWDVNGVGGRQVVIQRNRFDPICVQSILPVTAPGTETDQILLSVPVRLADGDTIQSYLQQSSGGPLKIKFGPKFAPNVGMVRVST